MVIRLGNNANPNNLYVGNQAVSRIYKGNQQVWPTTVVSSASASINIVRRSVTQVAPEAFAFDVSLVDFDTPAPGGGEVYDERLHDLYYAWDFGDSYNYAAPLNLLTEHRDAGVASGAKASHVYRSSGTYTVTCTVYEPSSGKSAVATTNVTVGNPDTLYAGANSIYVNNTYTGTNGATSGTWSSGTPSDIPAGALLYNDWDAAFDSTKWNATTTPRRFVVARDQTFVVTTDMTVGFGFQIASFAVEAGTDGVNKPVFDFSAGGGITWAYTQADAAERDMRWQNVSFLGGWDTTTQSGVNNDLFFIRENPPIQMLLDGCDFDGFNIALYPNSTGIATGGIADDPHIFVNDCDFTNWRSAAVFGDGNAMYVTGCNVAQDTEALNGYSGASNNLISAFRITEMPVFVAQQCDVFSKTGWVTTNVPGYYTTQSCFRLMTLAREGYYAHVSGCVLEGGYSVVSLNNSNGDDGLAVNIVVEKNIIVGAHDTNRPIDISYGGVTIRNNVCIMPNTPTFGIGQGAFVDYVRQGTDTTNQDAPQKVISNTFVNLRTDANSPGGAADAMPTIQNSFANYTNVTVANNLIYQPTQGQTSDSPVDTSVLWAPRTTHYTDDDTARDTSVATPASTIATYAALTGSPAIDDANTGLVAYDDLTNTVRGGSPDRGASED